MNFVNITIDSCEKKIKNKKKTNQHEWKRILFEQLEIIRIGRQEQWNETKKTNYRAQEKRNVRGEEFPKVLRLQHFSRELFICWMRRHILHFSHRYTGKRIKRAELTKRKKKNKNKVFTTKRDVHQLPASGALRIRTKRDQPPLET